jgi:hypothetical protein
MCHKILMNNNKEDIESEIEEYIEIGRFYFEMD